MKSQRARLSILIIVLAAIAGCQSWHAVHDSGAGLPRRRALNSPAIRDMGFEPTRPTQFAYSDDDRRSTFAVDVDTASFDLVRRMLAEGRPVPPAAVRTEDFVNAQRYGYRGSRSGGLAVRTELCPAPLGEGMHLLRVGIQARRVAPAGREPANVVLVLDTSGSMGAEGKFGLVVEACRVMLSELDERDRVAVIAYNSRAEEVVPFARATERGAVLHAISKLTPGGSTDIQEGLTAAYRLASAAFDDDRTNRLILLSDGVANEGAVRPELILDMARYWSADGIALTTVGVGFGEYNDHLLEQLANQGDGSYCYIDSAADAERKLGREFIQLGQAAATNVRVQVRFDGDVVRRYRLMGYDNRELADDQFADSSADGGEIGVGQAVTALYAVELRRGADVAADATVATVHVRYDKPGAWLTRKVRSPVRLSESAGSFAAASDATRLATAAAYFAEILRGTYWSGAYGLADIRAVCAEADPGARGRAGRDRLLAMIDAAIGIEMAREGDGTATAADRGWVEIGR